MKALWFWIRWHRISSNEEWIAMLDWNANIKPEQAENLSATAQF